MATEYLNNKSLEKLIVEFQKIKKERTKYQLFIEDIAATEKRTSKRSKFRKPDSWVLAEAKYQALTNDFQKIQQQLAGAFYTLAENIVRYAKFNLIDQDDAIQEGVMICFEKIDKFDAKKGKAFNYLTTVQLNAYRQLYRTHRNHNELKRKFAEFVQQQIGQNSFNGKNKISHKSQNNLSYD
jgi:hypothetical protein